MAETSADSPASASSPGSNAPHNADGSATKAPKDKACPFCKQTFTSSSLGRHLDLYIKPKNPKPSDGIHDVDKIRLIRGGITRRQPRSSLKGKQEKESTSGRQTPSERSAPTKWDSRHDREQSAGSPSWNSNANTARDHAADSARDGNRNLGPNEQVRNVLNAANWQATGVINNIPAGQVEPNSLVATPVSTHWHGKTTCQNHRNGRDVVEGTIALTEDQELGKAAQLALREVLDSLQAARERDAQFSIFDVDYFSMTFPSICLHIVKRPPTLFSISPFGDNDSWSLQPPDHIQYNACKRVIQEGVDALVPPLSAARVKSVWSHLENAFENWNMLSAAAKADMWKLEVLRAFAQAKEAKEIKEKELHIAKQQIEHLRYQYNVLSRDLLPRAMLLNPPETLPLSHDLSKDINARNPETRAWTYDQLISKWRKNVHHSRTKPGATTLESPVLMMPNSNSNTPTGMQGSHPHSNGVPKTGTSRGAGRHRASEHEEDDEEDADGDEDGDAGDEGDAEGEDDDMSQFAGTRSEVFPGSAPGSLKRKPPPLGLEQGERGRKQLRTA